jgi:hypothetical protein
MGNQAFIGKKLCGPYSSQSSLSSALIDSINSINLFSFIYYVISNPEPLIVLLIFVMCILLYKSDDVDTYKFYVNERENVKFY